MHNQWLKRKNVRGRNVETAARNIEAVYRYRMLDELRAYCNDFNPNIETYQLKCPELHFDTLESDA